MLHRVQTRKVQRAGGADAERQGRCLGRGRARVSGDRLELGQVFRGEGAGQSVQVTSDPVCEALEPGVFSLHDGAVSLSYELKDECDFDSRARWQAF